MANHCPEPTEKKNKNKNKEGIEIKMKVGEFWGRQNGNT